ncbi:Na/Pi cotransporter family protein [Breznakiella homolactica]|uniref:Na/Pi cotransporter family protein n=1 Tax=Breznakiella homolactica TaxID=2798577 RepID=A0A7T7XQ13_9SPIR|nr:Na/Pi cotransporter family protein [Breznakiella homolactica]QQO10411.1 Na/Pi cotransporter family protein [Breznakiella homolactica]
MEYIGIVFRIAGSLGLFLYGMRIMSDGIQQAAGDRLQRVLNFMTGNRFTAVLTGLAVTAIIQSSSATTVMVVSFVNAGLLTLTQSIGVIMGANIGTTVTAWIVSLIGFTLNISSLALPAVGLGFVMKVVKWKHRDLGDIILGFGLLFLGLDFLTKSMPSISADTISFIGRFSNLGFLSTLLGAGIGVVITIILHSSSASTAIVLTMAHGGLIGFPMAAAMILGANIGTTIDAALAAIGTKTAAKRAALVHILFNVIGTVLALIFFNPLLSLVSFITPGPADGVGIANRLAMFHTMFNVLNTLVFFPFVTPFAKLVSFLIKDKDGEKEPEPYKLEYISGSIQDTPEFNILRAEKEIRDMAGIAASMYSRITAAIQNLNADTVKGLVEEMQEKEDYADQMREELTRFLIECTRQQLNRRSEQNVSQLLRIIADLEDMTDDCFSVSLLLERSVRKELHFKSKEMEALLPYIGLVEEFLSFVQEQLGHHLTEEQSEYAEKLENKIDKSRNKLRKLGRKRIEAGENVKTELLFIDLVRRIEKLGDYCYNITEALYHML